MKVYPDLKYTQSHEWVSVQGNRAIIGISDYAQSKLGSIVFLEFPEIEDEVNKGEPLVVAESVKAASDVYAPLSGTVAEINEELVDQPGLVNKEPYENWLVVLEFSDTAELEGLMDAKEYESFCQQEE